MMTPAQVEAVARAYCVNCGQDPDASVPHSTPPDENGMTPAVMHYSPLWRLVANRVVDDERMRTALLSVLKPAQPPRPLIHLPG
jgi:hypothetical protein